MLQNIQGLSFESKYYIFKKLPKQNITQDKYFNLMIIDDSKKDIELLKEILSTESNIN
jgi:hypothetical protein